MVDALCAGMKTLLCLLLSSLVACSSGSEECAESHVVQGKFTRQVTGEELCNALEHDPYEHGLPHCEAFCRDRPEDFPYSVNSCSVPFETHQRLRELWYSSLEDDAGAGDRWCRPVVDVPLVEVSCQSYVSPPLPIGCTDE